MEIPKDAIVSVSAENSKYYTLSGVSVWYKADGDVSYLMGKINEPAARWHGNTVIVFKPTSLRWP